MNIIKQALTKINMDKDTAPTERAEVLSEMKDIKIESITFEDSIKPTRHSYRIYFKSSEDDRIHRTYIAEPLFNLLLTTYEWMEIDRNEHTETDPDTGYVSKTINSIMIAVVSNKERGSGFYESEY